MSLRVTDDEYKSLRARTGKAPSAEEQPMTQKPSKYHNRKVTIGEETFDSKAEAARWVELGLMQQAGLITDLRRQVPYSIDINGYHICKYIADFGYMDGGRYVVEDVKGVATPIYKLKKKLLHALYDVQVKEVRKK